MLKFQTKTFKAIWVHGRTGKQTGGQTMANSIVHLPQSEGGGRKYWTVHEAIRETL